MSRFLLLALLASFALQPWELFKKATTLDPTNDEAKQEFEQLNEFLISEYEEEVRVCEGAFT